MKAAADVPRRPRTVRPIHAAVAGIVVWTGLGASVHGGEPPPGKLIVDHARHQALTAAQPAAPDLERLVLWAEAAARVSPELAEAYYWQFDLLTALGRDDEATAALARYCERAPDDVAARLDWIDRAIQDIQTLDGRIEFCVKQLDVAGGDAELVSDLHRRLAGFRRAVGDDDDARRHAAAAVEALPLNVAARELLCTLEGTSDSSASRARLLLTSIAAAPAEPEAMWELAGLLDSLSLHDLAASWYERAIDRMSAAGADPAALAGVQFDLAKCRYDAGDYERALDQCDRAAGLDASLLRAQLLGIHIAKKLGRAEPAEERKRRVREWFERVEPEVFANRDARTAAQLAWFYLDYDPNLERARKCADLAQEAAPADPEVRRVCGFVALRCGDGAKAIEYFSPLAQDDPLAAVGLGEAKLAAGDRDGAVAALRQGEALRATGLAAERITELMIRVGVTPAARPAHDDVVAAVEAFDARPLEFAVDPTSALSFTVTLDPPAINVGEPVVCTVTLGNHGAYPITLGEGRMLAPVVLVSAVVDDGRGGVFPGYCPIPLLKRHVLAPGQSITAGQTIDVGPVAPALAADPQRALPVAFSFALDPAKDAAGRTYRSRLSRGGDVRVDVQRAAVDATPAAMSALIETVRSGDEGERVRAARVLAALIRERLAYLRGRIIGSIQRIDHEAAGEVLIDALEDESPMVRAEAVRAVASIADVAQVDKALAPMLSDGHWLVRLTTVDYYARKQGALFAPVAGSFAANDADDLVRRMCAAYASEWRAGRR